MKQNNPLKFGTAGIPFSTPKHATVEGIYRSAEIGATAMELEWVRGVRLGPQLKKDILKAVQETGITLTAHAPYYINLNSPDPLKLEASKQRICDALLVAAEIGVVSLAVHAGFNHGATSKEVSPHIHSALQDILNRVGERVSSSVRLSLETMGKPSQFGSLAECIAAAKALKGVGMVLDISHLFARSRGQLNSLSDFQDVLQKIQDGLGVQALQNMHIHLSGIEFGNSGERRHLMLSDSKFNWCDFIKALAQFKVGGILICESPDPEQDLLQIMQEWHKIHQ
jgi:deoxyribonuclease-4